MLDVTSHDACQRTGWRNERNRNHPQAMTESGIAKPPARPCIHLISVRTVEVRAECYYILYPMANSVQDVANAARLRATRYSCRANNDDGRTH
jgi:hypothetical protein